MSCKESSNWDDKRKNGFFDKPRGFGSGEVVNKFAPYAPTGPLSQIYIDNRKVSAPGPEQESNFYNDSNASADL
ncbi:hypothetical protein J22TS1_04550 [Siminovitchia terrae]|nr:hypothetical protein J22TS1_04550 [Siminovitchia terrae]